MMHNNNVFFKRLNSYKFRAFLFHHQGVHYLLLNKTVTKQYFVMV